MSRMYQKRGREEENDEAGFGCFPADYLEQQEWWSEQKGWEIVGSRKTAGDTALGDEATPPNVDESLVLGVPTTPAWLVKGWPHLLQVAGPPVRAAADEGASSGDGRTKTLC